jgi:hypothetical protein
VGAQVDRRTETATGACDDHDDDGHHDRRRNRRSVERTAIARRWEVGAEFRWRALD